jgi:hypothetical protein
MTKGGLGRSGLTDSLNATLAIAKQAYEDLARLVPADRLEQCDFGTGGTRERVGKLLRTLNSAIASIRRFLNTQISDSVEVPVLNVPIPHRSFYNDVVVPHGKALQRAHLEFEGLGFAADLFLDDERDHEYEPRPTILSAMTWGLERWSSMLDDGEAFDWLERGFNIEAAEEVVALHWFRPDEWLQNIRLLEPILVNRQPNELRNHVRYRLTEIYRAFTFGLWMAAIAMSRSLAEFSLRVNAPRFEVSTTITTQYGREEDKSLRQLADDFAAVLPALAAPLETVREAGNRILHPQKRDVIAIPKVMRAEALNCIRAAKRIVEEVHVK